MIKIIGEFNVMPLVNRNMRNGLLQTTDDFVSKQIYINYKLLPINYKFYLYNILCNYKISIIL